MTFTLGSLFSGIGGIDLAFERAGFEIAFQVEIDAYCRAVLAKHWPGAPKFEDVKDVGHHNLPAVDVLAGGFPCQDISSAGKQAGIKNGTRSGLWYEFARIIGDIRPRFIFIENVPAITTNGGTIVIETLAEMGYDAEWTIVSAADVGAPHLRERWFCVAYANGSKWRTNGAGNGGVDREHAIPQWQESADRSGLCSGASFAVVDAHRERCAEQCSALSAGAEQRSAQRAGGDMADSDRGRCEQQRQSIANERPIQLIERQSEWRIKPEFRRVLDGLPDRLDRSGRWPARPGEAQFDWEPPRTVTPRSVSHRVDRLKALGNAVVPQVIQPFAELIRDELLAQQESSHVS